jgi:hypothetical protein
LTVGSYINLREHADGRVTLETSGGIRMGKTLKALLAQEKARAAGAAVVSFGEAKGGKIPIDIPNGKR